MTADKPGRLMVQTAALTAPEPVRLAVVADPHVGTRATGSSKLFAHSLEHFTAAVADITTRDVDAVLSPGDLTKDGEDWNVEAVETAIADLDVPFLAVPGNHDVPKTGDEHDVMGVDEFADRFGPGSYPFHEQIRELDVLGLNSAGTTDRLSETHDGRVDTEQLDWLRSKLATTEHPLVLVHHNLESVTAQIEAHRDNVVGEMAIPPTMREPDRFIETLARGHNPLVVTGHLHLPLTGVDQGVREIAAPTTCSFPQSYLLFVITPSGTEVRLVPVTDMDGLELAHDRRARDSLTARGLTSIGAARVASLPLAVDSE